MSVKIKSHRINRNAMTKEGKMKFLNSEMNLNLG